MSAPDRTSRRPLRRAWGLLAGSLLLAAPVAADETTLCNAKITTLPYTINLQGHYCFDRNLSTAITTGNAITINSDFVVLDLNNFKLGGGSAGLGTQAVGIFANNRKNVTVRNGNIRGFFIGIGLDGSQSGGNVIENNVLDSNTFIAVFVGGDGIVLRNNLISATGGNTVGLDTRTGGIVSSSSDLVVVSDNIISNTFNPTGDVYGIYAGGVMDHNVVHMGTASGASYGIYGTTLDSVCRDNTVLNTPNALLGCTLVGDNYP
jgi:hypothetical protein